MPDPIALIDEIKYPAQVLLGIWNEPSLRGVYPYMGIGPVLGGYGATLAACGEVHEGDIDFYLPFPLNQSNHQELAKPEGYIGAAQYIHKRICAIYQKSPMEIRWKTNGKTFFQFALGDVDYSIGYREIHSNFQVSICLQTHKLVFCPIISTHEKDFYRYKNNDEIITYNLESLIQSAEAELAAKKETQIDLNALAWVMKSYIKPLNAGKHFSLKTAMNILALKDKGPLNLAIQARIYHHYELTKKDVNMIFVAAQTAVHKNALPSEIKTELRTRARYQKKIDQQQSVIVRQMRDANTDLKEENDVLKEKLTRKSADIKGYEKQASDQQGKIAKLEQSKSKQGAKLADAQKKMSELEQEKSALLLEVATLNATAQDLEKSLKEKQKEVEQAHDDQLKFVKEYEQEIVYSENAMSAVFMSKEGLMSGKQNTLFSSEKSLEYEKKYNTLVENNRVLEVRDIQVALACLFPYKKTIQTFLSMFNAIITMCHYEPINSEKIQDNIYYHYDCVLSQGISYGSMANDRYAVINLFLRVLIDFLETRFMQEAVADKQDFIVALNSLLEILSSPKNRYLNYSRSVDKVKAILKQDLYEKEIKFFACTDDPALSPSLVKMCDQFTALERLAEFDPHAMAYGIRAYAKTHNIPESVFKSILEKRIKYDEGKQMKEFVENQFSKHFSSTVKLRSITRDNAAAYLKKLFKGLVQKFPGTDRAVFLKLHFHFCLNKFPDNEKTLRHPLFLLISPLLSIDDKAIEARKNPNKVLPFIEDCVKHLQVNTIFPEHWRRDIEGRIKYIALINIYDEFAKIYCAHLENDFFGFVALRQKLINLAYSASQPGFTPLRSAQSIEQDMQKRAQILIQGYYPELSYEQIVKSHEKHFMALSQYIPDADEFILICMGGILRRVANADDNITDEIAQEIVNLLATYSKDKNILFIAPFSQWSKLFNERATLEALGITAGPKMHAIMKLVLEKKQALDTGSSSSKLTLA